jgi:hypothetical protein
MRCESTEGESTMNNEQMLAEIREANLTYLMLAQSLIRQDRAEAQFRLGLTEEAAELLAALSPAQSHESGLGQHAAVPLPCGR